MESAAAAGIAFHAVETVVGLTIGAVGTLSLAPRAHPWPAARLWLRPRIGRAVAAAGPVALLLAVVISAIGAHAALT